MDGKAILDLPMGPNDAQAETVRDYLKQLLLALWLEGECFSGKRPFGNSNWETELHRALADAGLVDMPKGWGLSRDDEVKANNLITAAIQAL